ncbi:MAG: ribosome assembly cofactor RimP [Verrucomicrobia bacterium]|nr:ribosome assembly cofactor RimP [Verrucomicrobiota bacterium]|tara:strand:- start:694 stop:1161 length:468 start_codon:yes stop_codon:yes gene_type:complete
MIDTKIIGSLVNEAIEKTDYFIVDLNVGTGNKIRIEIDGDRGVKIDDCVSISRHIESNLDRDEEDYELTVSSAGMDQPFKILRQYQRYLNRMVEVKTIKGEKIKGKLLKANEEEVELEISSKEKIEGKKKKQLVIKNINVPMEQVKETKVIIVFN